MYRKQQSRWYYLFNTPQILFELLESVVNGNPPASEQSLKLKLRHLCQNCRLAQGQSILLKESNS